ncbi:MAG: AmmeMemoRadiSam system protein A [Thiogranum sp.]
MSFSESLRTVLLDTARQSIRHGLAEGKPLKVEPDQLESPLSEPGASFVTLRIDEELRGCIGSLQSHRSLICDVAENAFAAAFRDPRFPPLKDAELKSISLDISVLSQAERIVFDSQQDLLAQIRPKVDGLILKDGNYRGTFLPSVWKSLPDAEQFLQHLKLKAGLPADHWSDELEVWRYTTESFGDKGS